MNINNKQKIFRIKMIKNYKKLKKIEKKINKKQNKNKNKKLNKQKKNIY